MTAPGRQPVDGSRIEAALRHLAAPVDGLSLVTLRVGFGLTMLWGVVERLKFVHEDFVLPAMHFTYAGFWWVRPLPAAGMTVLFVLLAVCAAFVAVGLFTRWAALLFGLGFGYVFLLERALYLNHDYLSVLLAFVLAVVPAGRTLSLDARLWPSARETIPRWTLWFARFHIALPYVFGGIAKLRADWLRGQPLSTWIAEGPLPLLLGPVFAERRVGVAFAWGGMLFDLAVVPLLLWRRTRTLGVVLTVTFHLLNATMFDIGVFPWLMIPATLVLLPPDWLRNAAGRPAPPAVDSSPSPRLRRTGLVVLGLYVLLHLLLPFRFLLYPGNPNWTEEGTLFAWHMMLRYKVVAMQIVAEDRETGDRELVDPSRWLNGKQFVELGYSPELLRQFAHFVREDFAARGRDVAVRAVVWTSLNGRKPQWFVDPSVDLGREPWSAGHTDWIVPLQEPFRDPPWNEPAERWQRAVGPPP